MHADRLADRFAVRHRAAETMHAVRHEDARRFGIDIDAIRDQGIFRDFSHLSISLFFRLIRNVLPLIL